MSISPPAELTRLFHIDDWTITERDCYPEGERHPDVWVVKDDHGECYGRMGDDLFRTRAEAVAVLLAYLRPHWENMGRRIRELEAEGTAARRTEGAK